MKFHKMLWFVAGVTIAGCATPVGQKETSKRFNQPFDPVWSAVVSSVAGDWPLQVIEKNSGILETQMNELGDTARLYAYEPGVFLGVWGRARGRLSFYVHPDPANPNETIVRVTGHFEGNEINVTHQWHTWPSKGVLETDLLSKIESSLTSATLSATAKEKSPNDSSK